MKVLIVRLMKWRVMRYLISGGSAAVTNIVVLFILVHFFHLWYLLAAVMSFIVAVFVSFTMQKFFTFNDYTREKIRQQTALYFGIQILNLCLNAFLLYISVDMLHIHYLISQILILGFIAVYSFFLFKHLVFVSTVAYNEKNQ